MEGPSSARESRRLSIRSVVAPQRSSIFVRFVAGILQVGAAARESSCLLSVGAGAQHDRSDRVHKPAPPAAPFASQQLALQQHARHINNHAALITIAARHEESRETNFLLEQGVILRSCRAVSSNILLRRYLVVAINLQCTPTGELTIANSHCARRNRVDAATLNRDVVNSTMRRVMARVLPATSRRQPQ